MRQRYQFVISTLPEPAALWFMPLSPPCKVKSANGKDVTTALSLNGLPRRLDR